MAFRKELRSAISPSWAYLRHFLVSDVLQNDSGMEEEYPGLSECRDKRRGTPFCTREVPAFCARTQHKVKHFVENIRCLLASEQPIYGRIELDVRLFTRADWFCFIGDKKHRMWRPRNNSKISDILLDLEHDNGSERSFALQGYYFRTACSLDCYWAILAKLATLVGERGRRCTGWMNLDLVAKLREKRTSKGSCSNTAVHIRRLLCILRWFSRSLGSHDLGFEYFRFDCACHLL